MNIINNLAEHICRIQAGKPILVAFDGVDASGKTTMADRVFEVLKSKGKNSIRISMDKFHHPKEHRMRRGELSPEGFFYDSFNLEKIVESVLMPVKRGAGEIIHGIFDYRSEKPAEIIRTPVTQDLIILFDGIFLNRDELKDYWDLSVFLDVSFETVLKRAIKRDIDYLGSVEEVERKYLNRYIPGEKIYLSTCNPLERADFVIDNNDYNNKLLLKGIFMIFEFLQLNRDTWIWFEKLFLPADGCDGCWCYNHHITPGSPDVTGEAARKAFKELVEAGRAKGIITMENGEPAGWCAVDKLEEIPGHDCVNEQQLKKTDGWAVHCFYIRPASRGKGLTRLLLKEAIRLVESHGGRFIEAYPTPANDSGQILDFCGNYKIFINSGFTEKEAVSDCYSRLVKELQDH